MTIRASVLGKASNTARISSASRPSAVSKTRNTPAPRRLANRMGGRPSSGMSTSMPGTAASAQQRAHRPAHSPAAHEDEAFALFGKLIGELRRHPATE